MLARGSRRGLVFMAVLYCGMILVARTLGWHDGSKEEDEREAPHDDHPTEYARPNDQILYKPTILAIVPTSNRCRTTAS